MQRRVNEFTLEPINNIMMGSVFGISKVIPSSFTPVQPNNSFLLLSGANMLLLTGQDFLLLE
jgi:hypothetical protein